jgi:transposase-like protein
MRKASQRTRSGANPKRGAVKIGPSGTQIHPLGSRGLHLPQIHNSLCLGGERTGGKRGRGAPGKTPFVAAVETTPEGKPVRLKLRRVASFCNHAISMFAKRSLDPSCAVVSDGLACFDAVAKAGCTHEVIKTGSGAAAARIPGFKWVNTALGNIKAAIVGTYRAIDQKHVPRYLAEFEYRFNRRYDLAAMMPRLRRAGVRTTPMPYQLLKLADVYV